VIRVFIVAPIPALRAGLRAMLLAHDIDVVDDVDATDSNKVDVVVATKSTSDTNGVTSLVLLSDDERSVDALRKSSLRSWALLPSDASTKELLAAVRATHAGLIAIAPQFIDAALALPTSHLAATRESTFDEIEHPLTPRELEVLERVSRGLPSKVIATELDVSESTIKFHLSSIFSKLNVSSRTEAVSKAARLGLITL
jgi:DNA-binding NarL/FixJ family response regulator